MKDFMKLAKEQKNKKKVLTTNGAVAYKTSGKELLDFNMSLTGYRKAPEKEIEKQFTKVYYENPLLALKYLFYMRDVRGGQGERRAFRVCTNVLANEHPEVLKPLLGLIPEYGRWDDLSCLVLNKNVRKEVADIIYNQLVADKNELVKNGSKANTSLAAKWIPRTSVKNDDRLSQAYILMDEFGCSQTQYNKVLASLRKHLRLVETSMSNGDWTEIDYEAVPSGANVKYNKAFLRHDEERRRNYLDALSKGEAKINAGTLNPADIVAKYISSDWWYGFRVNSHNETLEQLWKAIPKKTVNNVLVVRDGSGSMTSPYVSGKATPLHVATALAIYTSENNTGIWKDKFITFSSHPEIVDFENCKTLREKLVITKQYTDCSNTNIYSTMKLILDTAVENELTPEEMPKTICILSDMQFDGYCMNFDESLFERISIEFNEKGYELPRMCFWNICGNGTKLTVPMQQNKCGLVLSSGFSTATLDMFMSDRTDPYEILVEQLNTERYKPVEEAVKDIL